MGCTSSSEKEIVLAPGELPVDENDLKPVLVPKEIITEVSTSDNADKPLQPEAPDPSIVPEKMMGWLSKEGHVVKSWKSRYFVMENGILTYYVNPQLNPPYGVTEKGKLYLHEYFLIKGFTGKENRSIMLSHRDNAAKDLLLDADTTAIRDDWEKALTLHIEHGVYIHKSRKNFINIS